MAAAIKQPAILAAYALPLMVRPWADWSAREVSIAGGRMLASIGIAIGTFSLVTLATGLGFGWINAVNVPGMVMTIAPFTVIGQGIQLVVNALGHDPTGWAASVSGSDVIDIVDRAFKAPKGKSLHTLPAQMVQYGHIVDERAHPIDEVLVTCFHAPHSYTGENSVEISCHG